MITARNLTVLRAGRRLIDDVSLDLTPGTLVAVVGPNGAGKSTLLKVVCGELKPDAGTVSYAGAGGGEPDTATLARLRAVLPQATQLAFPFTAFEIVRMGAVAQGARQPRAEAMRALARVGLRGFENRPYPSLSGGEQQRVQFARALAQVPQPVADGVPRALFLDEPTASLDLGHQIAVLDIARAFAAAGGMVFAVLHDLNLAAEYADRILVLQQGRMVAEGPSRETIKDAVIAGVYGISGAVGRLPPSHIPYVLPQSRHR